MRIIFWLLGRSFVYVSRNDTRVLKTIEKWDEGLLIVLAIEPAGPYLSWKKLNGFLEVIDYQNQEGQLVFTFKSLDSAYRVLTGQIGIDKAFAWQRFTLKGDIGLAMSFVRCISLVEAYLFPDFIVRKILKKVSERELSRVKVYLNTIFGNFF